MKELLCPVGNKESLYAAIHNGADAVYLGGKLFGARKFAPNFTDEELKSAVEYSHLYGVKVYITANTIIYENEIEEFTTYIDYLYGIGVDALIMQDIGMISLVKKRYPNFEVHASTQMHNHNNEGISLLKSLGVSRIVLDREMTIEEINNITNDIEKEVFIHGALCNSYSGCCLFSSLNGRRSGNRGECVQSCRMKYKLLKNNEYITKENKYLLSTKELNVVRRIKNLLDSNITSYKIEGRMKSSSYVGYITRIYRKLFDNYYNGKSVELTSEENDNLKILFNRDFTLGYLFKASVMNINTSNHQGLEIGKVIDITSEKIKIKLTKKLYQEDGIRFKNSDLGMIINKIYNTKDLLVNSGNPEEIIYIDNKVNLKENDIVLKTSSTYLEKEIMKIKEKKIKINIKVESKEDKIYICFIDENKNMVSDYINASKAINRATAEKEIKEKITKIGNTPYIVDNITISIDNDVFISMRLLNEVRRKLISKLSDERIKIKRNNLINNVGLEYQKEKVTNFEISVLARTEDQVKACLTSNVDRIYVDLDLYEKHKDNHSVYLRLPRVINEYHFDSRNILITELGAINKYNNKEINVISDYYLNVVNNYSIKFMLDNNIKRVTLSPEVEYNNLDNLFLDKVELIVYGRLELMLTKSCPIKELKLCPCSTSDKYYLEDIYNNKYPIIHEKCLTHVMHYRNINYLDKISYYKDLGIKSFRLELFDEEYNDVIKIIAGVIK